MAFSKEAPHGFPLFSLRKKKPDKCISHLFRCLSTGEWQQHSSVIFFVKSNSLLFVTEGMWCGTNNRGKEAKFCSGDGVFPIFLLKFTCAVQTVFLVQSTHIFDPTCDASSLSASPSSSIGHRVPSWGIDARAYGATVADWRFDMLGGSS